MNKIYLLTAMLLVAAAAMAGVSAPQRGPQKLAHGLPVPVVKPATNVSDAGFTANWEKVSGANCYTVYTYIRHKAPADETYYFYNDDFSGFKYGSIESPFDIGWGWLDGYTNRSNWYVYGAYSCHGVFGLYNKKSAEQNGMLMSPMYNFAEHVHTACACHAFWDCHLKFGNGTGCLVPNFQRSHFAAPFPEVGNEKVAFGIDRSTYAGRSNLKSVLVCAVERCDFLRCHVVDKDFSVETNAPTGIGGCRQTLGHLPVLRQSLGIHSHGCRGNGQASQKNVFKRLSHKKDFKLINDVYSVFFFVLFRLGYY